MDGKPLLLGPNEDMTHFWFSKTYLSCRTKQWYIDNSATWWGMEVPDLEFKNGKVTSSHCTGECNIVTGSLPEVERKFIVKLPLKLNRLQFSENY